MDEVKLNLARKWRSKNFDQIVGQDLSVRMLKNSLYREQYFPVYLFSGQRGCGKTTTARVFAMALNCALLKKFQQEPQTVILPCLQCDSCIVGLAGRHPDFIEIDAASHNGVDNVRQIVDAASYLPILGSKKIYLIDEAHMLSKAAFNALLKVLEEPPQSTIFILATTDLHKIIDTVQSRCFQLFFSPIDSAVLCGHLRMVCQTEEILFEENALALIVKESEGSARDALNLLEQVRFSTGLVTKEAVLQVLGYLGDEYIIGLFEAIALKGPAQLLFIMKEIDLASYDITFIWQRLLDLIRALLWIKYGLDSAMFVGHDIVLNRLAGECSVLQLNTMLEVMYTNENVFQKVMGKNAFFEIVLLQLCKKNISDSNSNGGTASVQPSVVLKEDNAVEAESQEQDDSSYEDDISINQIETSETTFETKNFSSAWNIFVKEIVTLNDPLVASVMSQGNYLNFDPISGKLDIEFSSEVAFFKSLLEDTHKVWMPLIQKIFKQTVQFNALFTRVPQKKTESKVEYSAPMYLVSNSPVIEKGSSSGSLGQVVPVKISTNKYVEKKQEKMSTPFNNKYAVHRSSSALQGSVIDTSDASVWKVTHMIMRHFPGTVREIRE